MAYQELDYRLGQRKIASTHHSESVLSRSSEKTPNRKSIAKKKWWAEKKAREAEEINQ